jgi:hypothetical protein
MDVVNQVLLLLFAKTFTGEGIAAAEKEHRSGRRSMWHASVLKPVARLLHPLQSSAYGQLLPKPLAHGRLYVSVSNDPVHQSRSILHLILRICIVFECYSTYFYTSQLSAITSPCIYRPL